jgi:uncharacterized YccA/Bax inhibitor family protein
VRLRSNNPALSDVVFDREARYVRPADPTMTLGGTIAKTAVLVVILATVGGVSGYLTSRFLDDPPDKRPLWLTIFFAASMVLALLTAVVTSAQPRWSAVTAPLYAVFEGWAIGAISTFFDKEYAGIVLLAVAMTVGVLVALLAAYTTRFIKPTENLKLGIAAATGGLALVYGVSLLLGLFGIRMPFIHTDTILGIVFSLIAVTVAAFNLVLHFDFIENGVARGAPKYMEWYAGFGLLVTLVWLYIELLNLLAKLRSRNKS